MSPFRSGFRGACFGTGFDAQVELVAFEADVYDDHDQPVSGE